MVLAVLVGVGVGAGVMTEDEVVLSLHPNQPGELHVVVVVVVVSLKVVDVIDPVVVVSSRHPHQPGVLQVSVRVCVVFVLELLEEVVVSELLLS